RSSEYFSREGPGNEPTKSERIPPGHGAVQGRGGGRGRPETPDRGRGGPPPPGGPRQGGGNPPAPGGDQGAGRPGAGQGHGKGGGSAEGGAAPQERTAPAGSSSPEDHCRGLPGRCPPGHGVGHRYGLRGSRRGGNS